MLASLSLCAALGFVPVAGTDSRPARLSKRPGNVRARVLVVEYHHVSAGKGILYRSPAEFRRDLRTLYVLGFRPITARQYVTGKFSLPPGASPVVMTFDDSNPSQFRYLPDGKVDPNCAVGIWHEFERKYPDFPLRGTFYVLPNRLFDQPGYERRKIAYLRSRGCEIGNHTSGHRSLGAIGRLAAMREIAGGIDALRRFGVTEPVTLAYPYGVPPRDASILNGFTYAKRRYAIAGSFVAAAAPAPSPHGKRFWPHRLPRVQACSVPWGLDFWMDRIRTGQTAIYTVP
ncbi:MAG: polysaccharide deacetylase family protein [Fimbriimonadaceae bacterium]|nr:polysaccharide deacetylase family protein [Fimbriimonadaceae bacterium]